MPRDNDLAFSTIKGFRAEGVWRRSMRLYLKTLLTLVAIVLGSQALAVDVPANDFVRLIWPRDKSVEMIDSHGRVISPISFHDRLVVITFVTTSCTILCVKRTMDLDRLARELPDSLRQRVIFLALDTDPDADDAKRLRAFADSLLEPGSPLKFLRANSEVTRSVMENLHYPATALPEPPPTILLFDRRGGAAMSYGGDPLDASRLERDLAALDTFTLGLGHPPTDAPVETHPSR